MNKSFTVGAISMAVVLTVSNYLVLFPLGDWLTYAAFTYPLTFLITDCVNRVAGAACARRVVMTGFCIGMPLSFITSAGAGEAWTTALRVAAASGGAFILAQLLDVVVFDRLRRAVWWMPPLISSAPAAFTDTVLFFSLAFAGTGLPWETWAAGDFAVKIMMVIFLLLPYRLVTIRLQRAP
ncbi:queuosine precursor transporter [Candidatus Persebacteraceae bacterium Df01]|jgi:uncharacterized integral membrane protein (TIGR00697 family)|uniref:Queuosine precursor transporter n=1 Tax=Candidatus Doriopsillibacter californiensis TaxID=2970740 RepID=A0ABT7QK56_9GAMM|nr:queuosine precursor transporter [Candidatus Persebacteraceae bacterium Df01]